MFIGGLNWETTDGKLLYLLSILVVENYLDSYFYMKYHIQSLKILSFKSIKKESLRQYFSQFGEVLDCTIMRDPTTQRSRGFAFLTMKENSDIDKIVSQSDHHLDGKRVSYQNIVYN